MSRQRRLVAARFSRIYDLARRTGNLERLVIFGGHVTARRDPSEVDIILVMRDDFDVAPGADMPTVGGYFYLAPRHVSSTVNNFDHSPLVVDGTITGVGRVTARARETPVVLGRLALTKP